MSYIKNSPAYEQHMLEQRLREENSYEEYQEYQYFQERKRRRWWGKLMAYLGRHWSPVSMPNWNPDPVPSDKQQKQGE